MFLILPKGCQYGSDRCYSHCVLWCFEGLFWQITITMLLWQILLPMWQMLLPLVDWCLLGWCYCQSVGWCYCQTIYGWCYCHVWLMLLPLLIVVILADVIANVMADVFTICGRWNSLFICDGLMLLPCGRWYSHLLECDTFVIQKTAHKEEFFQHLNSIEEKIQFTAENTKADGALPFLDTLVTVKKMEVCQPPYTETHSHQPIFAVG